MTDIIQGLSASELMTVWERGNALGPLDRGVLLLAYSLGLPEREAARIDIARRDQHLLRLRSATLGTQLETLLECGECGEALELTLDARQFLGTSGQLDNRTTEGQIEGLQMRLPDSDDLRAAAAARTVDEARRTFFLRCVRNGSGEALETEPTEAMLAAYSTWLAETAPEIEIDLEIDCPACGTHRTVAFDVVSFFWREIESTCSRLAREVDALARTYGWSEHDILSMSSTRRHLYLEAATA